jgi:hypothetical protein
LLIEVASWTGFEKQPLHASTLHPPKEEEKPAIMAAIMSMGTNIGLTKMAEETQVVSYRQTLSAKIHLWYNYTYTFLIGEFHIV